jgi:ParB/RepB/Spo0J family partition protein
MTTTAPATTAPSKVVHKDVPVSKIDRDPSQPREHFDETKLQELALSMSKLGQLQAIQVRYNETTRRYTLVMGERRWRAAKLAGLTELRAEVLYGVPDGDPETLARAVAENVGRADMTPLEEAKGFDRLVKLGYPLSEVSAMCGKSEAYVGWRIDLLKLALPLQEALIKGHVPVGLAWYVANLSADNQQRFLTRYVRGDFATTRDAESFAQACRAEEQRQSQQGSMFVLSEDADTGAGGQDQLFESLDVPAEERERIADDRKKLVGKLERLDAAGAILLELAAMDPAELATLLSGAKGGVHAAKLRVEHLKDAAGKAAKTLRAAQSAAAVRASAVQVNPEAAAANGESAA